jgi:hypothetical protein
MNRTLTLTLLTSAAVAVCGSTAQAMTLYQDTLTAQTQEASWISPITGTINVFGTIKQPHNTSHITANGWFGDKDLVDLEAHNSASGGATRIESLATIDVSAGSVIDFLVNPADSAWSGLFDIKIELASKSGVTLPVDPNNPPPSLDSGLVFLGRNQQKFDHVGLWRNGKIYESSPAYQGNQYYDILDGKLIEIEQVTGVQREHTLGSFLQLADNPNLDSSPVKNREVVEIPSIYGQDVLKDMEDFIVTQLGKGYGETTRGVAFIPPDEQKGYIGIDYTGIGLIERAAEEADVRGGQGFIPNRKERIPVDQIFAGSNLDAIPWECLEVFPTTVDCQARGDRNPNSPFEPSVLSPEYLHYILKNGPGSSENWLQGWFQNIDFILTDPLGRRLGYIEELGLINEITYTNDKGEEAPAFYTGDGETEHFILLNG